MSETAQKPSGHYWMARPIEDLSRAELLAALIQMFQALRDERESFSKLAALRRLHP